MLKSTTLTVCDLSVRDSAPRIQENIRLDFSAICTYIVLMKDITFVWDPRKNLTNQAKHEGVDFEEAKSIFYDENARLVYDPIHSSDEDRFVILGLSAKLRLLVVCHCYRESDSIIRIISARKATKREEAYYERYRHAQ